MCFALRLHMSAAPTQGGLTPALGRMKISWRTLTRQQAHRHLLSELRGRVFHITSVENFLAIVRADMIKHNGDGTLKSNGKYNSYFKNRGCVSFCDFHNNVRPRKVREAAIRKYDIFGQGGGESFVFLFLTPNSYSKLIPWTRWKTEKALSEMVVPHLESGYPGAVPLAEIDEANFIHIPVTEEERHIREVLLAAMQKARSRGTQGAA